MVLLIYAEYYILENFIISYIIISCTYKILRLHGNKKKKVIGATIGAIYAFAYLYPNLNFMFTLPFKIFTVLLIVLATFGCKDIREYIRVLVIFYAVNIFISGSTFFIIYFTGLNHITISFIITACYISSKLLGLIYKDIKTLKEFNELKKQVKVVLKDNVYNFDALLDSGNLLKDPVTKDDVMIIDAKKLDGFLPYSLIDYNYKNIDFIKVNDIVSKLNDEISSKVRIIPCKQVGRENGILIGFKADYLEVNDKKISNVIIGLSNFDENDDYNAIINPNVLI